MDSVRTTFTICGYGLIKLVTSSKLYAVLLFLGIHFSLFLDPLRAFLEAHGASINLAGLFAMVLSHGYNAAWISLGAVVLFSDAPFIDEAQQGILLRTGQRLWLWGQIAYIAAAAFLYMALLVLLIALPLIPYVHIGAEWCAPIYTFVTSETQPFYALNFSAIVMEAYGPLGAFALSFFLRYLVLVIVALVIFIVNSAARTKLGALAGAFVLLIDTLNNMDLRMHMLSVSTLSRLDMMDYGFTPDYPSVAYSVAAVVLAAAAMIALTVFVGKRVDVVDQIRSQGG